MKKVLILAAVGGVLAGCASQSLAPASGKAAFALPVDIKTVNADFACSRTSLFLQSVNFPGLDPIEVKFRPKKGMEYALFDNIKPGNYDIVKSRCYPASGWSFTTQNGGSNYLDAEQDIRVSLKPNKITMARTAYVGYTKANVYSTDGGTEFNIKMIDAEQSWTDKAIDALKSEQELTGWTVGY
ncbi:hypothetical protein CS022_18535 [Veronia nyctiphanis]|uniref:DUF2846 domain-containing protein n=1 Tax=Veronia nyctiphanis TaxID=1278244 RepID=A0A4Q0YMC2_9GAMM|nr:hypothetical protein [Veronia nyctiphanis]RXJ71997.1 hypothetical protein CS022_18535 [Veronia nyctiphanis]